MKVGGATLAQNSILNNREKSEFKNSVLYITTHGEE